MKLHTCTLMVLLAIVSITMVACRPYQDAKQTIWNETRPREINRKYEWFKDAHAQLTSKQAQIAAKQAQLKDLNDQYTGVARKDWARIDIQNQQMISQELQGLIASFNNLAAEYNSEMSKWHTEFTNFGMMPAGSSLPKSFIPYTN